MKLTSQTRSKISASIKKVHATGRKMDGSKAAYSKASPVLSSLDGIGSQTQVVESADGLRVAEDERSTAGKVWDGIKRLWDAIRQDKIGRYTKGVWMKLKKKLKRLLNKEGQGRLDDARTARTMMNAMRTTDPSMAKLSTFLRKQRATRKENPDEYKAFRKAWVAQSQKDPRKLSSKERKRLREGAEAYKNKYLGDKRVFSSLHDNRHTRYLRKNNNKKAWNPNTHYPTHTRAPYYYSPEHGPSAPSHHPGKRVYTKLHKDS